MAAEFSLPESFDAFHRNIPQEWIKEAVAQTGRTSVRKRRFPAEQAVWLVIGIGLMRNRSIAEVCDKLDLAFPDSHGRLEPMASSSVTKARNKLGCEPLHYLFHTTAAHWEKEDTQECFHGLKVLAVDGTQFHTPETKDNQQLGYASGQGSFPSVLAVALMSVHSHLISDVAFGPVSQSEIHYAQQLVGSAPENSLTLFDRAYFSAELLLSWQQSGKGCHWLTPIKSRFRHTVEKEFTEYDQLISMPVPVSPQARAAALYLPEFWTARLIRIPQPNGKIKGFITSLTDPVRYPFSDLVKVYWDRWEIEQGYGEY
ncbi:IS4 family transposase [Parendozoicomonas sp. Alg238-R29]|uniref:IS4 family transposase n=1 Tax=Parendozoicomonas sp. Alg238-R29 TaxID=2993446 RepID=UPI00248EC15B|nr:IS4 family transposase [Parendozoicomonas sp. Alg238-R29]